MPASFPALKSGVVAKYPVVRDVRLETGVVRFEDDTEQRWVRARARNSFRLQFSRLSEEDVATIEAFFRSCKGKFDTTWDITIGGTTYSHCTFEDDTFAVTETSEGLFTVALNIRQVRPN